MRETQGLKEEACVLEDLRACCGPLPALVLAGVTRAFISLITSVGEEFAGSSRLRSAFGSEHLLFRLMRLSSTVRPRSRSSLTSGVWAVWRFRSARRRLCTRCCPQGVPP
eukprot:3259318-Pleurochrysis_carterae.AAC.1